MADGERQERAQWILQRGFNVVHIPKSFRMDETIHMVVDVYLRAVIDDAVHQYSGEKAVDAKGKTGVPHHSIALGNYERRRLGIAFQERHAVGRFRCGGFR